LENFQELNKALASFLSTGSHKTIGVGITITRGPEAKIINKERKGGKKFSEPAKPAASIGGRLRFPLQLTSRLP